MLYCFLTNMLYCFLTNMLYRFLTNMLYRFLTNMLYCFLKCPISQLGVDIFGRKLRDDAYGYGMPPGWHSRGPGFVAESTEGGLELSPVFMVEFSR